MQASSTTAQREQMFSFIEQWKVSGQSQQAYLRAHGVTYHSFHYWYKVYKDHQGEGSSAVKRPAFVPLHLEASATRPLVELVFLDGKRIVFYHHPSADFLKALL
jgi:hypothetical protein